MHSLDVVDTWYNEISLYDYNSPGFSHETGHFTQLVWRDSSRIGIGYIQLAKNKQQTIFLVANYEPKGNVSTKFPENVFPRKKIKS